MRKDKKMNEKQRCHLCGVGGFNGKKGLNMHCIRTHGQRLDGSPVGKKKPKKIVPQVNETPGICSLEVPGQIGGQNIMLTVDLSIAATAIRPV
jgi:hypothetical protein